MLVFSDISLYKKNKGFYYEQKSKKQRVKGIFTNGNNRNEKNEESALSAAERSVIFI